MARIACVFSVEVYGTVDRPLLTWRNIPFGLSMIAACLEDAGHEVHCWVICPASPLAQIASHMLNIFGCDFVAATAVSTQFPLIASLCREVKRLNPAMPIVLGGSHPSLNPQSSIAHPEIDAICIGEGEKAAVAFADFIDAGRQPAHIPGMWIKNPGQIKNQAEIDRTPPPPFVADLDALPLIKLEHWEHWVNEADRSFRVVIGRGCPFGCTYCSNHALKKVTTGKYVRFRSTSNIMEEINRLVARYPEIDHLYLEIETIGAVPAFAIELCNRLAEFNAAREVPLAFRANLAVTTHLAKDPQQLTALLSAFYRANLTHLNIGLESGSERIRKEILNRPGYTNADLITVCNAARKHGIRVSLFVLMGLPTETAADFLETAQVARACDPTALLESIFYPYPGTKLYDLASDMHLFDPSCINTTAERARPYLKLEGFPHWRIYFEYVFVTWRVFHGKWSFYRLTKRMAFKALGMTPGLLTVMLRMQAAFRRLAAPQPG